jgi:probable rRNA maturation factor
MPPRVAGGRAQRASASPPTPVHYDLALQNPNRYAEVEVRRLRTWLTALVPGVIAAAGKRGPAERSLGVRFASDRALHAANRDYRRKDKPTDVLSFPGDRGGEGWHLGDILISVPTARRQASAAGHDVRRELQILVLHGLLHCLGYDHERDHGEMTRFEGRLRRSWIDHGTGDA